MNNNITLLNPFSVMLKKHPFMQVSNKPIYQNGNYRIYAAWEGHYVHTFKNIVIAQRGAANTNLVDDLASDNKPTNESDLFHNYERPKEAIAVGKKAAKELNFKIS